LIAVFGAAGSLKTASRISKRVRVSVRKFGLGFPAAQWKLGTVKAIVSVATLVLLVARLDAQEIELPPIVVDGTFELRAGPSVTDLFTLHLERQLETKRSLEESIARSPWYYSTVWKYAVIPLGSSRDTSAEFFTPHYMSAEYRNTERVLEESRKQSLFNGR
jgi:hypothetical protein